MIHTIVIDSTTKPDELRKIFRKKLMTGGAVIRLAPGLTPEQLVEIGREFLPGVVENNVNSMVLSELARCPELPESFARELENLGVENVKRAFRSNSL